ncbi:hypothetical protein EIP86_008419 [Pleurotus ostreatoroseus]|nr:hypothetical protein EIP86_008419 [Pleurotus ostreatoroseus]
MSFITKNGRLVRDMWPAFIPRIAQDKASDKLKAHEKVPDNMEDLLAWAHVRHFTGKPHAHYSLLHSDETVNTDRQVREVFLRLQGYVLEKNLEPLGDWDGKTSGAPKARQFLTLHGSVDHEAFDAECQTLGFIRDIILRKTRSAKTNTDQNGRIYLHNKVFTKVRPGAGQVNTLSSVDDPFGRAESVAKSWIVTKKIKIAFQDNQGKLKKASHYSIKPGDFVDVKVRADITTYMDGDSVETRVYFSMEHVVRLCKATDIPTREMPEGNEPEIVEEEGLNFDDNEEIAGDIMALI